MPVQLLVASTDAHFREVVRENLVNIPGSRVIAEYPDVAENLYIRVLQGLDRYPDAALVIDLAGNPAGALSALDRVRDAAPDLYVVASSFDAGRETVLAALRAGAQDFLMQPVKRFDFRDVMGRLERAPRRSSSGKSQLGKVYTFLGSKGGVGTTTLAVNFAGVLAQQGRRTVLVDLDWAANGVARYLNAAPGHTLVEAGEQMENMSLEVFEGLAARDALGFHFIGPPELGRHGYFTEPLMRDLVTFLVEKYDAVVIDAGRHINKEVVMAGLESSSGVFLVLNQDFGALRNAQRFLSHLMHLGFSQDQIHVLINEYQKTPQPGAVPPEHVRATLNQPVFYGIPRAGAIRRSSRTNRPFVEDRQGAGAIDGVFRAFVDKATGARNAMVEV
ncbi:MAG: MinD/ParA family protein [Acidobacteria bacterium]|nr:MinD/ParA family protein [Acidobacteriota bacterium]